MSLRIRLSFLFIAFLALITPVVHAQPNAPKLKSVSTVDGKSAQVSFEPVVGALHYKVYWSTSPTFTKDNAQGPKLFDSYAGAIDSLDDPSNLYFAGTVVTSAGESGLSVEMKATAAAPAPKPGGNSNAVAPVQPTTNVGQSADTNLQNPTMTFVSLPIASYPILGVTNGRPNGTITYDSSSVDSLVKNSCNDFASSLKDGSTYALINLINLGGTANAQSVVSNNWYVYSEHKTFGAGFAGGWKLTDFDGATRLYGAKKILLISIIENDLTNYGTNPSPSIEYKLSITKQQATNVSDVFQLLGLVFPKAAAPGLNPADVTAGPTNYWSCSAVPVAYKTSTVKLDTTYTVTNNTPYSTSQTFVNEAKEYWDVSFALPVKKASALQYDSTANTVTASQINKTALYAVFDWYPYPVDLKNSKFSFIPGIFAGVAMNSQPLHSFIFGGSIGTRFAQFYAGALLLKQQDLTGLSTGGTGTPAQVNGATSYVYKPQFSVGIKISISAAASALKGSK